MTDQSARRGEPTSLSSAHALSSTYVHLPGEQSAAIVAVGDDFWEELSQGNQPALERGRLVTQFDFSSDWSTWERHPEGEELVILLSGNVELLLALPDGLSSARLKTPGEFVIVPRAIWHTARTKSECSLIFVTHGAGTEHRPVETGARPGV